MRHKRGAAKTSASCSSPLPLRERSRKARVRGIFPGCAGILPAFFASPSPQPSPSRGEGAKRQTLFYDAYPFRKIRFCRINTVFWASETSLLNGIKDSLRRVAISVRVGRCQSCLQRCQLLATYPYQGHDPGNSEERENSKGYPNHHRQMSEYQVPEQSCATEDGKDHFHLD